MTFLKALKQSVKDQMLWFRPVSWRGTGTALCANLGNEFNGPGINYVPSSRGGRSAYFPPPNILLGKWEVVSSTHVSEEKLCQSI